MQDPSPRHVAIIMDGNGRWARSRGLPRPAGHRAYGGRWDPTQACRSLAAAVAAGTLKAADIGEAQISAIANA